jgi:predicted oxidoreductase
MMPRLPIAPQGPEFSRMVYGTWRVLSDQPSRQEINRRLQTCLERGITTIDTAEIYGLYEVEEALGRAIALTPGLRERLEIVTKAGIYVPCPRHPDRQTAHYDASGERMIKSLEKSLRLLGTDHVELLLVHRPDWLARADDTASGMNRLLREGKIRAAGVSNYTPAQFDLLNGLMDRPLATNQIEFHLLHMDSIYDGTLAQCEKAGVLPMAWSPLAGGRLFDASNEAAQRIVRAAERMAARYDGASLEQLAYAWILAHPSRPLPIVGSNRVERITSAAAAVNIVLQREDWYALWEAAQGRKVP